MRLYDNSALSCHAVSWILDRSRSKLQRLASPSAAGFEFICLEFLHVFYDVHKVGI